MNIEKIALKITAEDLKKLIETFAKKYNEIPTYYFSTITLRDLKQLVNLKKLFTDDVFEKWFDNKIKILKADIIFLKKLLAKYGKFIKAYKEETLKANFIIPIINQVDFLNKEYEISGFYEESITYETENFILTGTTDFVISKGLEYSEKPYFFIQEFKKGKKNSDPEPQLLAELITAAELNNFQTIKGAYIVGSIWNFVILQRLAKHNYQYFISREFSATNIADLQQIYKNLVFVKQEIIDLIKRAAKNNRPNIHRVFISN